LRIPAIVFAVSASGLWQLRHMDGGQAGARALCRQIEGPPLWMIEAQAVRDVRAATLIKAPGRGVWIGEPNGGNRTWSPCPAYCRTSVVARAQRKAGGMQQVSPTADATGFKKALRRLFRSSQLKPRDYTPLRQSYASLGRRKLVDVGDADALRASPPTGDEMNMIGVSCCRRRPDALHQDPKPAHMLGLDVVFIAAQSVCIARLPRSPAS
jgi:hypothetical protein